jgi:hypothetical protein
MDNRTLAAIITILVALGVLALMLRSWLRRSKRDAALSAGYPQPAEPGRQLASAATLYVATTPRDQPLERLAIPGLGFRARGGVTVTDQGVLLELAGSPARFIPTDAVELVADATWAIDRAVEPGGLFLLGWRLAPSSSASASTSTPGSASTPAVTPTSVDSYFRFSDPADRTAIREAIRSLTAGTPGSPLQHTEFGTEESEV